MQFTVTNVSTSLTFSGKARDSLLIKASLKTFKSEKKRKFQSFIKFTHKGKKHIENKDRLPNQAADKTRSGHSDLHKRHLC